MRHIEEPENALILKLVIALEIDTFDFSHDAILGRIEAMKRRARRGDDAVESLERCFDYIWEDSPGKRRNSWRTGSTALANRSAMNVDTNPVVAYCKRARNNRLTKAKAREAKRQQGPALLSVLRQ